VIERLVGHAGDQEFETVYAVTDRPEYLAQFGFDPVDADALSAVLRERLEVKRDAVAPEAVPMVLPVEAFEMPDRLRERFKRAVPREDSEGDDEAAEDFGIDPDSATYKYDTG
jgi:hypothetical protein